MNYFITRDGQQYGPYSLADLQRYVASGNILLTDLARSEGMSEPLPVSQIIGAIPVPQAQTSASPGINAPIYPDPPNLHWGLVLLFSLLSCGLFSAAWNLVQDLDEEGRAPEHSFLLLRRRHMRSGGHILCRLRSSAHPLLAFHCGSHESPLWHSHFNRKIQP